eukprot:gene24712-26596_t
MSRFQLAGKRRDMELGPYPKIGLADARNAAADARKVIARGSDPLDARKSAKKSEKPLPTFEHMAKDVIADAQAKSVNAEVRYQWERHLGAAIDITNLLRSVWREKPEVARKLSRAIHRVFECARIKLRDAHGITLQDNTAR